MMRYRNWQLHQFLLAFLNFCRTEGSGSQLFILPLLARRSYPTTGNNSQRLLNKSLQLTAWTV